MIVRAQRHAVETLLDVTRLQNGANVAIEATSMLKAESSGIASISGSPIKIG